MIEIGPVVYDQVASLRVFFRLCATVLTDVVKCPNLAIFRHHQYDWLADANLDGVEILAGMGYLIAQF